MKKNINNVERVVRVAGGAALASRAFWGPKKKWYLAFLVPVAEGFAGVCLLYSALGISTRSRDAEFAKEEDARSNRYFPVQSDSERAAGHPIVGVS